MVPQSWGERFQHRPLQSLMKLHHTLSVTNCTALPTIRFRLPAHNSCPIRNPPQSTSYQRTDYNGLQGKGFMETDDAYGFLYLVSSCWYCCVF
ncbi:hypothetical protein BDP27DRAFT_1327580, partial [Rhodocollybia butyracea]